MTSVFSNVLGFVLQLSIWHMYHEECFVFLIRMCSQLLMGGVFSRRLLGLTFTDEKNEMQMGLVDYPILYT